MDLILGYIAGLLTLINPCILPVLPIVLASAAQADRRAPLALAAGLSAAFVGLGLAVSAAGPALGMSPDGVSRLSALAMAGFGLVMLMPALGGRFSAATAGVAAFADARMDSVARSGLPGQFLGGALLGAVWSPCIGPTLGAAISLAAQGQELGRAGAVMAAFAAGVSTLVLALAYGARSALASRQAALRRLAARARPAMGATFLLIGLALWFRLNHAIDAWLLDLMPPWLVDLSVSI